MAFKLENLLKRFCVTEVERGAPPTYILNEFELEGKTYKSNIVVPDKRLHTGDFLHVGFCPESALKQRIDSKTLVDAFPIKYIDIHHCGTSCVYPKCTDAQQQVAEVFGNVNSQALQIYWRLNPEELKLMRRLKGKLYAVVSV